MARETALLLVPSAIVPEEYNVLINPRHDGAAAIGATTLKRWHYDPRLFS
jgi:RES domain-containing protein